MEKDPVGPHVYKNCKTRVHLWIDWKCRGKLKTAVDTLLLPFWNCCFLFLSLIEKKTILGSSEYYFRLLFSFCPVWLKK